MRLLPLPSVPTSVLCFALAALPTLAKQSTAAPEEIDAPLLPVPGLLRPAPSPAKGPMRASRCSARGLPAVANRLPFGPGEILSFRVSLLGFKTGSVALRVGERETVDNVTVYPLYAQVKTEGFLSVLGTLDGRMVSFVNPDTAQPVRMVNRFVFGSPFRRSKQMVREDAAFSDDGNVVARLRSDTGKTDHTYAARARASADLLDVLSVIYYARSRRFAEGTPFCFEIFHRRTLWRAEGTVGPIEVVTPPFGAKRARRIDAVLQRVGLSKSKPRRVTAWVSEDENRLPLLVKTPDYAGTLEVSLVLFVPGHRLTRRLQMADGFSGKQ